MRLASTTESGMFLNKLDTLGIFGGLLCNLNTIFLRKTFCQTEVGDF